MCPLGVLVNILPLLPNGIPFFLSLAAIVVLALSSLCSKTDTEGLFCAVAHSHRLPQEAALVTLFESRHEVFTSCLTHPSVEAQTQEVVSHTGVVLCVQVRMHIDWDGQIFRSGLVFRWGKMSVAALQSLIMTGISGGSVRVDDGAPGWFDKFSCHSCRSQSDLPSRSYDHLKPCHPGGAVESTLTILARFNWMAI